MTYVCPNRAIGQHTHELVYEAHQCLARITRPHEVHQPLGVRPTKRQLKYIRDLGGDPSKIKTFAQASTEIDRLKNGTAVTQTHNRQPAPPNPKLQMIDSLIDLVPDGYYAVQPDEATPLTFVRINRPVRGKYNGAIKLQTQHSDLWMNRAIKWPSGWWVGGEFILDVMLLLVCDPKAAAHTYASKIGSCQKCNKTLTDERSRWYGIGPDCGPRYPEIYEYVDSVVNEGVTYEQNVQRLRSLV